MTNSRGFIAGGDSTYAPLPGFSSRQRRRDRHRVRGVRHRLHAAIAGLNYSAGQQFASPHGDVVLRLSQSFGYSVGGGALYGDDRLGRETLDAGAAAVPEPSEVAVLGIGLMALALARRRSRSAR